MINFTHLTDNTQVTVYCQQIGTTPFLALDTEFIRENTYYPELSLIQIATQKTAAIIDILSISDFSPLRELLENPNIEKIMHSPDQDVDILSQHINSIPKPIYDTQLAAAFLGYEKQVSYKQLLADLLNIEIDKLYTRSSWLERPLSDGQLQYAIEDVYYLETLRAKLDQRLIDNNKHAWFIEEMQQKTYIQPSYQERLSAKYHPKNPAVQARFQQLANWRETVAQQKNRPRQWIISDRCLLHLAKHAEEKSRSEPVSLAVKRSLSKPECKSAKKYANELNQLLQLPIIKQTEHLPYIPSLLNKEEQKCLRVLQTMMLQIAKTYSISPGLLTNKKQLIAFIRNEDQPSGWRAELIGDLVKRHAK